MSLKVKRIYGIGPALKAEFKRCGLIHKHVAAKVGFSDSAMESYISNRQGIPEHYFNGILSKFPQINKKFLLASAKEEQQQVLPLGKVSSRKTRAL